MKYISNQQSPTPKIAILKKLRIVAGDTNLESEFSQVWVLHKYQLGYEVTIYGIDGETEGNNNFVYLVCQGRVRLLAFNATIGRAVLTQLLLIKQTFRVDHLFCKQPLAYRVFSSRLTFLTSDSCYSVYLIWKIIGDVWADVARNLL
ncbi:hypothetical protein [Nostoc sp.]|uniref:hypothetical protein n=1 Tax=Nostoc sp. TaxID=1180 RepID=UPI002FF9DBFE